MKTMSRIIIFIVYLITIVFVYLSSYGWAIEEFSTIQYVTGSLGISTGNWITLVGYCLWTFGIMEYVLNSLQTNTFLARLTILFLDVLAVPLSMVLFVLYNNTPSTGMATTAEVLNIFFLVIAAGSLNGGFMLVLKICEWLVNNGGNLILLMAVCLPALSGCSKRPCFADESVKQQFQKHLATIEGMHRATPTYADQYRESLLYVHLITGYISKSGYSSTIGFHNYRDLRIAMKHWNRWYRKHECRLTQRYVDSIFARYSIVPSK